MSEGLTVTLPEDLARAIDERVRSGRFTSAEAAVMEAVEALLGDEADEAAWIEAEVGEVFDRDVRGEEPSYTAEEVFGGLARSYAARRKAAG
jgi:Arc/MetJ-type ribon-helix-helix transcriptional regulator